MPLPLPPTRPGDLVTEGQSAGLVRQDEGKQGKRHLEPQAPPSGGADAAAARTGLFTAAPSAQTRQTARVAKPAAAARTAVLLATAPGASAASTSQKIDDAAVQDKAQNIQGKAQNTQAITRTPPAADIVHASAATPTTTRTTMTAHVAKTTRTKSKPRLPATRRKLFVLDTNVLLHDSNALFQFQEHDIFLPMVVLEELDHQKKGMSEVARNARQVSRFLDGLIGSSSNLQAGVKLDALGHTEALGDLRLQTSALDAMLPIALPDGKADNAILRVVHALQSTQKRRVILVSKDINMRLKARALGLAAEDYYNDHVLDDSELLYDGVMPLPENFWVKHGKNMASWQQGGITWYRMTGPLCAEFMVNEFVYVEGDTPLHAQVKEVNGKTAVLATLRDYSHGKNKVWGITARNREQNFALNLLMNPDCDFVSLLGPAGTGKTLLALASALAQTLEIKRYSEIIITRATVPVGDDIG